MRILPSLTFIFDRKKRATSTHEGVISLRITYERKSRFISTGVKCLPQQWRGGKGGVWICNRVDAQELNASLDGIMVNTRKMMNAVTDENNGVFAIDSLMNRMKRTDSKSSFVEFCIRRAEIRKYGKQQDTQERYERFVRWFVEWGVMENFSDITEENIMQMDRALKATGMKNYSKWNNYHRFLNSFINDAMDEGHIRRNPYRWVHIDKDKSSTLHKYLTLEELHMIEAVALPTASLERVRDLFIFQAYTCMAYTDLCDFDAAQVKDGMYKGNRGKTGQEFIFLLLEPAKKILQKYNNHLPIISNERYNDYLKTVAQYAGIDKPITSHWARHTGATVLLNEGNVDMEVVAKILGHSSTRQTRETYAKLLDKTIANAMSKAQEKIK